MPFCPWLTSGIGLQLRNYRSYVQREIENQVQLQHPLIVAVREVLHTIY